jgi:hypothetical protein
MSFKLEMIRLYFSFSYHNALRLSVVHYSLCHNIPSSCKIYIEFLYWALGSTPICLQVLFPTLSLEYDMECLECFA